MGDFLRRGWRIHRIRTLRDTRLAEIAHTRRFGDRPGARYPWNGKGTALLRNSETLAAEPLKASSSKEGAVAIGPGMSAQGLRTPALLVDLDVMEKNLSRMAAFFRGKAAKLRPHFKAHQVLSLACQQMEMGAIGLTCARLDHAEALVQQGIENILVANEIAGVGMIRHLIDLSRRAPVMVAVDNPKVVSDMAGLAGDRVGTINVVVDVDVRLGRCGVRTGEAALMATLPPARQDAGSDRASRQAGLFGARLTTLHKGGWCRILARHHESRRQAGPG